MGRPKKDPLYVLPHGIEVVGEYAPSAKNPYWRVRIRPHPFFPDVAPICGGQHIRRNRVVLASKLGRTPSVDELAHHDNEDRTDDSRPNIVRMTPAEHNRHHKTGTKHTEETKAKISAGLRLAIAEGRREPPKGSKHWLGKKHSEEARRRMSETRKRLIAEGKIAKSIPPDCTGYKHSEETVQKMKQAAQSRRRNAEGVFI